jgi:hypothetical protein
VYGIGEQMRNSLLGVVPHSPPDLYMFGVCSLALLGMLSLVRCGCIYVVFVIRVPLTLFAHTRICTADYR